MSIKIMSAARNSDSGHDSRLARRRNALAMLNVDQDALDRLRNLYVTSMAGNIPTASRQDSSDLEIDMSEESHDLDDDAVFISVGDFGSHPPSVIFNSPNFRRRRNGRANVLDSLSDEDIEGLRRNHDHRRNGLVY